MDREAILRQRAAFMDAERGVECRWFWLSFSGEQGWLGGCYVLAPGFITAVELARARGLNPGGEVLGFSLPPAFTPPTEMQNRLLSKADLDAMGGFERFG